MTRLCNSCGEDLPEYAFTKSYWKAKAHYKIKCRECANGYQKEVNRSSREDIPGYIYIIINPSWSDWCKIGLTSTSPEDRLKTYQTGSPFRDYELYYTKKVKDVYDEEGRIHKVLEEAGYVKNSEWFKIDPEEAISYF